MCVIHLFLRKKDIRWTYGAKYKKIKIKTRTILRPWFPRYHLIVFYHSFMALDLSQQQQQQHQQQLKDIQMRYDSQLNNNTCTLQSK